MSWTFDRNRLLTVLAAALLVVALPLVAEQSILVVNVRNAADEPLPRVRIGTIGDGSTATSDNTGRARIRLPSAVGPGSGVTLQIVPPPKDLVIMAPYQGRTPVPSFDNEADNYVTVLVIKRGDRRMLENGAVLAGGVARSEPIPPTTRRPTDEEPPRRPGGAGPPAFLIKWQPAAPRNLRAVASPITEEAAQEMGFSREEATDALRGFTSDDEVWNVVVLTAILKTGGRDPFSTVLSDINGGLRFGIGWWSLGEETLPRVLREMRETDPERFDGIMGADSRAVLEWLDNSIAALPFARARMLRGSPPVVVEPWISRFRALGLWPAFQRIQIRQLQTRIVGARAATNNLSLRSRRALGFLYYAGLQGQLNAMQPEFAVPQFEAFARRIGRLPDEQERLLILANIATPTAGANAPSNARSILLALALGSGYVAGANINVDQIGFTMRDLTPDQVAIRLIGDRVVLERLIDGWVPTESVL
jgi:hypothetical protein